MELTIRPLTLQDNDRLTDILAKLAGEVDFSHITNISGNSSGKQKKQKEEDAEQAAIDTFLNLFSAIMRLYRKDAREWFASLVGMSYEEYIKTAPFDADMQIIEQIKEAPGFTAFFVKACAIFKLNGILESITSSVKKSFSKLKFSQSES